MDTSFVTNGSTGVEEEEDAPSGVVAAAERAVKRQ